VVKLRRELNWFENRPLFGRRIVVTRTRSQASALSEKLRLLGADVLEIPTIRIQPRAWTATYETKDFHRRFDWIVFTSPNAVDIFFDGYCSVQGDLRKLGEVKIAAVGPATAAKVKQLRLPVAKQPTRFTVAELAHSFLPGEVAGQRFCLARGNLAEPSLAQYLQGLGGNIAEWTIYDTLPESGDRTGARTRFINEGADWVTFTSASTVKNWHDLHLMPTPEAASPRYASIGPVTSEAMQKLGYSVACEATESTIAGLVETLLVQAKISP
jgi:uroporphyrinogen III methyltransferase/synthase